jgi:hypothetical protein
MALYCTGPCPPDLQDRGFRITTKFNQQTPGYGPGPPQPAQAMNDFQSRAPDYLNQGFSLYILFVGLTTDIPFFDVDFLYYSRCGINLNLVGHAWLFVDIKLVRGGTV